VISYELYYRVGEGPFGYEYWAIQVDFMRGKHTSYFYTLDSAGSWRLEVMRDDAVGGQGLNGFINRYVKDDYEAKM